MKVEGSRGEKRMTVMDNDILDFLHDKFSYTKSRDVYGRVSEWISHDFIFDIVNIISWAFHVKVRLAYNVNGFLQ